MIDGICSLFNWEDWQKIRIPCSNMSPVKKKRSMKYATAISEPNYSDYLGFLDILLSCCHQECALTEVSNHALVFNVNISRTRHEFSIQTKALSSHWGFWYKNKRGKQALAFNLNKKSCMYSCTRFKWKTIRNDVEAFRSDFCFILILFLERGSFAYFSLILIYLSWKLLFKCSMVMNKTIIRFTYAYS